MMKKHPETTIRRDRSTDAFRCRKDSVFFITVALLLSFWKSLYVIHFYNQKIFLNKIIFKIFLYFCILQIL